MRILAAMSGGVDSSVVAGLLHEAGHEVIGVTLQLYDHRGGAARAGACCAGQDIDDARGVADRLGIAHYVIDAQARFADAVIARFADGYAAGQTPVPCVRCNQTVKFHDLLALADDLGAEALATGHYVRRVEGRDGAELHRAADARRDQSWFLFATTRAQLARSRFPLGEVTAKEEVRREAARLGLAVADKPDSQDICFVPSGGYEAAVGRLRPDALAPGEIVDESGTVLGRHDGIGRFTVGQGKRLGLNDGRVVIRLDAAGRRIVVGSRDFGQEAFTLSEVNWLIDPPAVPLGCMVKLRARDEPRAAVVTLQEGVTRVRLTSPALPAPGQACVFYDAERILGGGFIEPPP